MFVMFKMLLKLMKYTCSYSGWPTTTMLSLKSLTLFLSLSRERTRLVRELDEHFRHELAFAPDELIGLEGTKLNHVVKLEVCG